MKLFRRRPRATPEYEPSIAEIENSPEYLAAQEAVNHEPAVPPSGEPYLDTVFGEQPGIVAVPDEGDATEDDTTH